MSDKPKSTHTQPGGFQQSNPKDEEGVVNDSLGTVDPADSTGWMRTRKLETPSGRTKTPGKTDPVPGLSPNQNPGPEPGSFQISADNYAFAVRSTSFKRAALPRSPRM